MDFCSRELFDDYHRSATLGAVPKVVRVISGWDVLFGLRFCSDVAHARDSNELLEVLGDERRPVVGDNPGPHLLVHTLI